MGLPTKPTLDYSYTAFQQSQGDNAFPGTEIDNDHANLKLSIDETVDFLAGSFRSDGVLKASAYPGASDLNEYVATATTAADEASASAGAAAASAISAAASLDAFTDLYLGAKSSDPTLDNDGNPLQDGATYWNTSAKVLRIYDLGTTTWANGVQTSGIATDTFVGDGATVGFTLSVAPTTIGNTQVYVGGVYQEKAEYSVAGSTLTFNTAPPNGVGIQVMTFEQILINVPADGSVTAAKLANGAIEAKLGYTPLDAGLMAIFTDSQFGGVADWNGTTGTDNLAAWNAFLSYCQTNGVKGYVPRGAYYFSGTPTALGAGTIVVEGDDYETRFYCNGTTNPFFKVVQTSAYAVTVFRGIRLIAWNASGPNAEVAHIEYPSTSSFAMRMADIGIIAHGDPSSTSAPWAKTWVSGITLKNCWYPRVEGQFWGKPDISTNLGRHDGSWGIRIQGGSYGCIAPTFDRFVVYYAHHGLLCDAYTEGARFPGCEFVSVTKGITVPATTAVGGVGGVYRAESFFLDGNFHIAAFEKGLDLNLVQHVYGHVYIQRSSGSGFAGNWQALAGTNCDGFRGLTLDVGGNSGTGTATALYLSGGSGHFIDLITENVDQEYNITCTYSVIRGDNRAANDTAFLTSTSTQVSTSIYWNRSDGTPARAGAGAAGGVWTAWTPSVTAQTGSITTLGTINCAYLVFGKTVHYRVSVKITTAGTGADDLRIPLPGGHALAGQQCANGRESDVTGKSCYFYGDTGATTLICRYYDTTTVIANNARVSFSGTFEIQ